MLKQVRPTSNGQRHQIKVVADLHRGKPEKSLLKSGHLKKQGRGFRGRITVRHRGGGVKKRLRLISFHAGRQGVEGSVKRLEYDPNRSAFIALVFYQNGEKKYLLAPDGLKVGDKITHSSQADAHLGNTLPLKQIPIGIPIHNLELAPGHAAKIVRAAGTSALIQSKDERYATVLLPSKQIRLFKLDCLATIGALSNPDHKNEKIGKAGRKRLMGVRPTVRGTAQHPGSHPHGGGEGRSGIGLPHPKTPWGKPALGYKTRAKHKKNKLIIKDRRIK